MTESKNRLAYRGQGEQQESATAWKELPGYKPPSLLDPANYLAPQGLQDAVNVALDLGMPLLLTGDPGCGKSDLAASLAWEFRFPFFPPDRWPAPLRFTVKSDTRSRDLFYRFDTLGRFRAANRFAAEAEGRGSFAARAERKRKEDEADSRRFLRFDALGLAIVRAQGAAAIRRLGLEDCIDGCSEEPVRSVVLIDEIDKAPREVPNDILNELDRMSFEIPELFERRRVSIGLDRDDPEHHKVWPVVVITSNRERELPEAFLRRCVYYHLDIPPFRRMKDGKPFPEGQVTIQDIVRRRLGIEIPEEEAVGNAEKSVWAGALSFFAFLRSDQAQLQRKPSTAELLNWFELLQKRVDNPRAALDRLGDFLPGAAVTLLKHKEDQERLADLRDQWLKLTP